MITWYTCDICGCGMLAEEVYTWCVGDKDRDLCKDCYVQQLDCYALDELEW